MGTNTLKILNFHCLVGRTGDLEKALKNMGLLPLSINICYFFCTILNFRDLHLFHYAFFFLDRIVNVMRQPIFFLIYMFIIRTLLLLIVLMAKVHFFEIQN